LVEEMVGDRSCGVIADECSAADLYTVAFDSALHGA